MSETDETGGAPRRLSSDASGPARSIEARVHAVGSSGLSTISIRGFRLNSGEGDHVAGFDLGPGPDEHFLGALGASMAQAVSSVSCSHGLHVDRIDVTAEGAVASARSPGQFLRIDVTVRIESSDQPAAFDEIDADVLAYSSVASAIRVPIELTLEIVPIEPGRFNADDWQI